MVASPSQTHFRLADWPRSDLLIMVQAEKTAGLVKA